MNKKILLVSILAVFMLVAISYATAVSSNTTNVEKKESPLYRIRTMRAITEKISLIIENIKTKFLGERIFFLPFQWLKNIEDHPYRVGVETNKFETDYCYTCPGTNCQTCGDDCTEYVSIPYCTQCNTCDWDTCDCRRGQYYLWMN